MIIKFENVVVLGGGSFGIFIVNILVDNGYCVKFWMCD